MKKPLQIILLVLSPIIVFGQNQVDYEPVRCSGSPPSHMVKSAIQKNKERELTTSPYRRRNERLAEMEFYSSGTYAINDLLASGDVIYGENMTEYLENILKHILEANKIELDINIFPVKSSIFNAFATEQPVIFVNLGLIRSVRNESELAFIICHELAHHIHKHSIEGFLNQYKLENLKEFKSISSYEKILKKHGFSREMEHEADSIGIIYFKNTGYSQASAVSVFDLMMDEYEEYSMNKIESVLDFKGFYDSLPYALLDSMAKIHLYDPIRNIQLSSHPDSRERKAFIEKCIDPLKGEKFIQEEEKFLNIQKSALLESLRLSLLEGNYPQAYFIANIIIKNHPEFGFYAKKQLLKSLIHILDQKIFIGIGTRPKLSAARISSESAYIPILYYYLLNNEQKIINDIEVIFKKELDSNADEELNALNNWFIQKINWWGKYNSDLTTTLTEKTITPKTYSNDKKILMDPYFLSMDFRKVYKLDYLKTEKEQIKVSKKMRRYLKKDSNYVMLSVADKSKITSEILYDKEIISKRILEINSSSQNELAIFPTDYYQLNAICKKYDSQKVSITYAATAYYKESPGITTIVTFLLPPLGIALMAIPTMNTVAEYQEFDLITGIADNSRKVIDNIRFSGMPMKKLYFP